MKKYCVIFAKCYLLELSSGIIIGIIASYYAMWPLILGLSCLFVLAMGFKFRVLPIFFAIGVMLGGVRGMTYADNTCQKDISPEVPIVGSITEYPKLTDSYQQVILEGTNTDKLIAYLPRYPEYLLGDTLELSEIQISDLSEKELGYQKYLISEGICNVVSRADKVVLMPSNYIASAIHTTRNGIVDKYLRLYPEPEAGVVSAMVIGDDSDLDQRIEEDFKSTGTSHLLVVSGGNLMLLFSLGLSLAGKVNRKKLLKALLIIIIFYSILVGMGDFSIQRAMIMFTIYTLGLLSGRKGTGVIGVIYSAGIILCINPLAFLNLGFQYSFVIILSLILLTNRMESLVIKVIPKSLASALAVILVAQIGAMIVNITNGLSGSGPVSILANIVWLPASLLLQTSNVLLLLLPYEIAKIAVPALHGFLCVLLDFNEALANI